MIKRAPSHQGEGIIVPDRSAYATAREYNAAYVEEYRANRGEVTGPMAGRSTLILTTTGARSGVAHVSPLVYTKDGDNFVVSGANGGSDKHPDWYHNLLAQPRAHVEVGADSFDIVAREADGAERERLHERRVEQSPTYAENINKTTRRIPLMILERSD